jgi:acyl-CoA thioesterase FadM
MLDNNEAASQLILGFFAFFATAFFFEFFGLLPIAIVSRQVRQYFSITLSSTHKENDGNNVLGWYSFNSRVWPSDVDFWLHQNNVRYNSRCEEGRFHVMLRSGLGKYIREKEYVGGLSSNLVRFRRELKPFQQYCVKSRISGWDEKSFFIEHLFCSLNDGFVNAHGMSTFKLVRKVCEKGITPAKILRGIDKKSKFTDVCLSDGIDALKNFDAWSSNCFATVGTKGKRR